MTLTYGVVDTETTGFDHEADRLVEVAVVRDNGSFSQSLVNPGDRRISYGAMATHHITQEMVANAPSALEALADVGLAHGSTTCWCCEGTGTETVVGRETKCEACDGLGFVQTNPDYLAPDVLVFHNAAFDRGFLPEYLRDLPHICTWRCSLHLVPHAESHSNGALWYELGLARQLPAEAGAHPHRALFDALMTRDILEWMMCQVARTGDDEEILGPVDDVRGFALQRLIELTRTPVLLNKCRFGKHRDSLWEDVPSQYMEWVLSQDFDEDTKHTCRHWLQKRGRA